MCYLTLPSDIFIIVHVDRLFVVHMDVRFCSCGTFVRTFFFIVHAGVIGWVIFMRVVLCESFVGSFVGSYFVSCESFCSCVIHSLGYFVGVALPSLLGSFSCGLGFEVGTLGR